MITNEEGLNERINLTEARSTLRSSDTPKIEEFASSSSDDENAHKIFS